jgi:ATP-dependent DNA helicase RecG
MTPIACLQAGVSAQVEARVEAVERGFRYRPQLRVALIDESKRNLTLRFFHFRAAQAQQFVPGTWLRCYGEARDSGNGFEMVHPSYQRIEEAARGRLEGSFTPVYPATEGLGQSTLLKCVARALERLPDDADLELLPESIRRRHDLPPLREALLIAHRPPPHADTAALLAGTHPAQRRLAFEELLAHQLSLRLQRLSVRRHGAPALRPPGRLAARLGTLPFALTGRSSACWPRFDHDLARCADAAPGAGRRRLRQDRGCRAGGAARDRVRNAGGADGADRTAGRAALAQLRALVRSRSASTAVWLAGKVKGKARAVALARIARARCRHGDRHACA